MIIVDLHGFSHVFRGFSMDFPMFSRDFLWISHVFKKFSMDFSCFPEIFPCFPHIFPGIPMDFAVETEATTARGWASKPWRVAPWSPGAPTSRALDTGGSQIGFVCSDMICRIYIMHMWSVYVELISICIKDYMYIYIYIHIYMWMYSYVHLF